MLRILQMTGSLGYFGVEAVIMNYYRNIDRTKMQFDFVVNEQSGRFDEEVQSYGGNIYRLPSRSRHPIAYYKALKNVFKSVKYDIFHCNANSAGCFVDLLAAKKCGVKVRIAHSHNTDCVMKLQHYLLKPLLPLVTTDRFACSTGAGKWMFGNNKSFALVNNGIELDKYSINQTVRQSKRAELGLSENFIVGHIGSFQERKNQELLIDAVKLCNIDNIKLVLIGEGGEKERLQQKVNELGLSDKVLFLPNRNDIPELLQAFDIFAFPSKYEGLSVVAIEAQASGILTLISDKVVTESIIVPERCCVLPIDNGAQLWSEAMEINAAATHIDSHEKIRAAGYDIKDKAKWLQNYYINAVERSKTAKK